MVTRISLFLISAGCIAAWAADTFHPLDIKTGQWEYTTNSSLSGAPPVPPEAFARMTNEQRAMLEEKMKALEGRGATSRSCVTKEKLDKPLQWGREDKACSYNLVTSNGSAQEIHVECAHETRKSSGTVKIQALNSESIKGLVEMTVSTGGKSMNTNMSFTGKWIAPTCGSSK